MSRDLPELVAKLCYSCDGFIVGGGAVQDDPRDYDVVIPFSEWNNAAMLIPETARPNSFGGWECKSEGYQVDVWPAELSKLMTYHKMTALWHPKSRSKYKKIECNK